MAVGRPEGVRHLYGSSAIFSLSLGMAIACQPRIVVGVGVGHEPIQRRHGAARFGRERPVRQPP
jgi:hypothetical protein